LGFSPIATDSRDERFGVVRGERIDSRTVSFLKTRTPKIQGWVLMDRPVSISKLEGTFQHTDGIVVGLFTPIMAVCNGNKTRVSDVREN
jgi:hypothetical protein